MRSLCIGRVKMKQCLMWDDKDCLITCVPGVACEGVLSSFQRHHRVVSEEGEAVFHVSLGSGCCIFPSQLGVLRREEARRPRKHVLSRSFTHVIGRWRLVGMAPHLPSGRQSSMLTAAKSSLTILMKSCRQKHS